MNPKNSPSFDTTCQLCSSTFTDPTTRDAVVFKTYTYERNFSDLRETASSGCLLCKLLLVRHLRYNPGLGDAPNSHDISFDIHTANRRVSLDHPNQFTSDSLPLLVISGIRTDREDEVKHDRWTQKQYSWFLNFEILAEEGDNASRYVGKRPTRRDVGSPRSFEIGRGWMKECLESHGYCPKATEPELPSRVLDVSYLDSTGNTRLLHSGKAHAPYAALSYCWGVPQPASTTSAYLESYQKCIILSSLPKTVQDAIFTTRQLGLQYLWVDSLCIVQDSTEDKASEIANMGEIFRNATITILAASAKTCDEGFLQDRLPQKFPLSLPEGPLKTQDLVTHYYHNLPSDAPTYTSIPLPFLCPDNTIGTIHLQEQTPTRQLEPLYARAWAMQEIMLSPRHLLYSTTQLHYKCRSAFYPSTNYTNWQTFSRSSTLKLSQITLGQPNAFEPPHGPPAWQKIEQEWETTVGSYSSMVLSYPGDKLLAFSGLAAEFQKARGDEYLAGLWKRRLLEDLTWRRATASRVIRPIHPVRGPMSRPTVYRCPSWSWMAIDGPVAFGSFGLPLVRDVKCTVTPLLPSAPFGAVTSGSLELSGRLTPVLLAFEPDKKRHLLENVEADKLLSLPGHDGAPARVISHFLPDVPDEIDWGRSDPMYALPFIEVEATARVGSTRELHGFVLVKGREDEGAFKRIGYFFSTPDGYVALKTMPRDKIVII